MNLSKILGKCKTSFDTENFSDRSIEGVAINSKKIMKNFIFAAIQGNAINGEKFIPEVLRFKSIVIIIQSDSKLRLDFNRYNLITIIRTDEIRKLVSEISSIFYPNKIKEKIAVTGTNGKTSIVDYTRQIWDLKEINNGCLGTLGVFNKKKKILNLQLTTPDPVTLNRILNKLYSSGCRKMILEASSIGLEQNRLFPLKFEKIAFTNLTNDHLDYHKSFKKYKLAKSLLFTKYSKKSTIAVVNTDTKYSSFFQTLCKKKKLKVLDFGKKAIFLKIDSIKKVKDSFYVNISLKNQKSKIIFHCVSIYEIYNRICSLILVFGEKLSFRDFDLLKSITNPPGRLENIYKKKDIKVFVDYAHTPDALKNVLSSLRKTCKGNLILVFGCGGERDKEKRIMMTREALAFSDNIIITDDNPRNEDPNKIIDDMMKGLKRSFLQKIKKIRNRENAIKYSIKILKKYDVLLIAGKGHENYQIIRNKKNFFSDKLTALKFLGTKDVMES